jgi:chromosome segregation ATPase
MADTDVAGAVRGGRLTSALRYSGMGLVDAMARSPDRRANRLEGRTTSSAADRELQRAAQDLERAQAQLHDAERAVTAAETTLAERRDVAERAGRRVREAKEAVRRAKTRIGRRRGA